MIKLDSSKLLLIAYGGIVLSYGILFYVKYKQSKSVNN
jgi:hypothetical protein